MAIVGGSIGYTLRPFISFGCGASTVCGREVDGARLRARWAGVIFSVS